MLDVDMHLMLMTHWFFNLFIVIFNIVENM